MAASQVTEDHSQFDSDSSPQSDIQSNPYAIPGIPLGLQQERAQKPKHRWNWFLVVVSWVVILSICCFLFYSVSVGKQQEKERPVALSDLMQVNMAAKTTVGWREFLKTSETERDSFVQGMDEGPLEQRYCQAVVIAEIQGPTKAIEYLKKIDEKVEQLDFQLSSKQKKLRGSLKNLLADYQEMSWEGPSLTQDEKDELVGALGWCGRLAIFPKMGPDQTQREQLISEAKQTAIVAMVFGCSAILAAGLGFILCIVAAVMLFTRQLGSRMSSERKHGGIYIETFALWMVSFIAASIVGSILVSSFGFPEISMFVLILLTLTVLLWPIIRGVDFRTMREDVGLTCRNPIKEVFFGFVAYLVAIPFLGAAFVVVFFLTTFSAQLENAHEFAPPSGPSHPIQQDIAESQSWMPLLYAFLAACVAAPIVEEIVFRGLLYRHKRELTRSWGFILSVAFSVIFNGLLFAMIHPQGLLAIPMLATLAIAFCLAREWRDSLIAPMTMHAINNGAILALLILTV